MYIIALYDRVFRERDGRGRLTGRVVEVDNHLRYVTNKPVGTQKIEFSGMRAEAYKFETFAAAQAIRDDALEFTTRARIIEY